MRSLFFLLFACSCLLALGPAASAQDQLTKQALARIEKVEKLEPDLKAGDVATANRLLSDLNWAGKRLNAVYDKTEKHYKSAVKRYQAVRDKVETKARGGGPAPKPAEGYDYAKLLQLNKEIGAAFDNLKLLSVSHLADDFRAKSVAKEIEGFTLRLAEFPAEDSNVKVVAGNLAGFRKVYEAGMAQLAKDKGSQAAMEAHMAELSQKYDRANLPAQPSLPLVESELRAWAAGVKSWRSEELPADLEFIQQLRGHATVNQQKVSSLLSSVGSSWPRYLNESEFAVRDMVRGGIFEAEHNSKWVLETDGNNPHHVQNRILGKGNFDMNLKRLLEARHAVAMAKVCDEVMPDPQNPPRAELEQRVESAIQHLNQLALQCLEQVRMPQAASTDAALLKIAAETLKQKDSGVGEWKRMVINSDKVRREKKESYLSDGKVSGARFSARLTHYHYVWDQFQVTTAEQEGDQVWLYANTLKHYHSGGTTTPIGRWILAGRIRLTPILADNVAK